MVNGSNGGRNGESDSQPSKSYEHVDENQWAEFDEETGEVNVVYDLNKELGNEDEPNGKSQN